VRTGTGVAAALLVVTLATFATSDPAHARPPNLVLIVADDLGWSDLGSFGGEIETPTIDRLAYGGVRFTRFYATPRCSPTRAALLTGVWSHEAGVAFLDRDWDRPAYRGAIHDSVPTIAERLHALGYSTYMIGKWHLSPERAMEAERAAPSDGAPVAANSAAPSSWPLQRGFDSYWGTLAGSGSYFDPADLLDGNQPAAWPAGRYLTDVLGEQAATTVSRHLSASPEHPFFLYLAFTAPHWPLHAPDSEVDHYRGRFAAGWDELRAARFARQRELGVVAADAELPPRDPSVTAWDATPDREWQQRRMEVYAAMVTAMDRAIARVIETLEQARALDDTVIVFLSDNGASAEEFSGLYLLAPLFTRIPEMTSDGRAVRFGDRPDVMPGPADTYTTVGRGWAHLSNTPLRGYKHSTYEGGIAVPFIVHWPAGLRDRSGSIVAAPGHVVDVTPTLLELAGAATEASAPALRGRSLLALLRGSPAAPRTLYWEHEGNRAILDGDAKLVSRWPFGWELHDLARDRVENDDLAAAQPDRAAELAGKWSEWASTVGVESWPMVVPLVRNLVSFGGALLVIIIAIARARAARRAGSAPRSPGPFRGGPTSRATPPQPPRPTVAPGRAPQPPAPIRPR
jgi:arylsulfatase